MLKYIVLMMLASGCVSISYLPTDDSTTYPPTQKVEVYWNEPERAYFIIGKISASSDDLSEELLYKELKNKAQEIGAQAIIMKGTDEKSSILGVPVYGGGTLIVPTKKQELNVWPYGLKRPEA